MMETRVDLQPTEVRAKSLIDFSEHFIVSQTHISLRIAMKILGNQLNLSRLEELTGHFPRISLFSLYSEGHGIDLTLGIFFSFSMSCRNYAQHPQAVAEVSAEGKAEEMHTGKKKGDSSRQQTPVSLSKEFVL